MCAAQPLLMASMQRVLKKVCGGELRLDMPEFERWVRGV